eukprot:2176286-Amphidinium_carterae.1
MRERKQRRREERRPSLRCWRTCRPGGRTERRERRRGADGSTGIESMVFRMQSGCDATTRKRAAEAEADDGERASREEAGESAGREMRTLSSLLAEGATVLQEGSKAAEHEEFFDGRGCVYLTALDTAITVEEPDSEVQVEWNRPRAECFYDEYTGIELPREGVIRARHEEMATTEECFSATGRKPYGVRWVDSDKNPNPETRGNSSIAVGDVMSTFAATPRLETLRLLCSLCMSAAESDDFVFQVWDISRAHQHCKLKRKVFIRLPEEDPCSEVEGVCGLLVTALI